jgi:hypothetical protein
MSKSPGVFITVAHIYSIDNRASLATLAEDGFKSLDFPIAKYGI